MFSKVTNCIIPLQNFLVAYQHYKLKGLSSEN
jgi:hypothetical protein